MDWEECCSRNIVKGVNPDEGLIKSLIKSSKNRLDSESMLRMNEITAASKISLAYDSLRELLEALAIKNGYKIYNHECYTAFLKEVIKDSGKGDEFDEIRKIRNEINYYGKEISIQESSRNIGRIKALIDFLNDLLKK